MPDPPKLSDAVVERATIRPLRRVNEGCWRSRDERWTFMRHWSDPVPQRWFAYLDDDTDPLNGGLGQTTLTELAEWATKQEISALLADPEEGDRG